MRSSPSNGTSRPPLKKKVTCAYFSVSAACNCLRPCSPRCSQRQGDILGAECDMQRQILFVLRHGDKIEILEPSATIEFSKSGCDERADDLARPVGAKVEEDGRVSIPNGGHGSTVRARR